ncbi:MAG: hypothetical protein P4L44_16570 [Oryzomonas sp.]|uniref:hypothetical protein n=1 Tax=Oryzomonas sp. TaxID=2855186 RepID=UPI00284DF9A8|nr:hypothetical protein [Oryzomonas sp.]MDR3581577.1 hypothetical protein [Oryzomonas sp.]
MTTRSQVMSKIMQVVGRPGQKPHVIEKALDIFDAVALHKSIPTAPNREKGEWTRRTDERNERERAATASRMKTAKRWRLNMDGKVFDFQILSNGNLQVALLGSEKSKVFTPEEWKRFYEREGRNTVLTKGQVLAAFAELDAIQKSTTSTTRGTTPMLKPLTHLLVKRSAGLLAGNAKQQPAVSRTVHQAATPAKPAPSPALSPSPVKAEERPVVGLARQPWGQNKRIWGFDQPSTTPATSPAPSPAPAQSPSLAQNLRQSVHPARTGQYSGQQLAMLRLGGDPNLLHLDKMTLSEMKAAVSNAQNVAARQQAARQGIFHGPDGETYHTR